MSGLSSIFGWTESTTEIGVGGDAAHDPHARLARALAAAAHNVPFYRRHWQLSPADEPRRLVERFRDLPVLRKSDLHAAEQGELLDRRFAERALATEYTSGTTGPAFAMRIDAKSHRARRWRFLTALLGSGYLPGRRMLIVSSQPTALVRSRQRWANRCGWHYVDLDSPESEILRGYARARPEVLYGPLGALLDLAARMPAGELHHRPRSVISTGEQLLPQHRRALRNAFGREVADFYGMTELGLVAHRPQGAQFYRLARGFCLEFLPEPESEGLERLVVTDLQGGALPMIRFDTGDLVRRDHGRPGRPLMEFVGRSIDALVLADGARLSPYRLITALGSLAGAVEFRILQQADRSIDLTLRCAAGDAAEVAARARHALSTVCPGLPLRIATTTEPWPRPDGKLRAIRSLAASKA